MRFLAPMHDRSHAIFGSDWIRPRPWIYAGTYPGDADTTPDSPPFLNGWANAGGGLQRLRFRLTNAYEVEFEGAVTAGTDATAVIQVPSLYRPVEDIPAPGVGGDWVLQADGDLVFTAAFGVVNSIAKSGDAPLTGDVTLSAGTNVTLTESGNDISIAATGGGGELDYVERNTDLTVTAASAATAQAWIDGNAITYDGSTRIKIEAWCALVNPQSAGGILLWELYDGSTDLGVMMESYSGGSAFGSSQYAARFLTPSAGAHTFHVKAWQIGGGGNTLAAAPTYLPAWMRITEA